MRTFKVHTIETAPEKSKELLEDSTRKFGMVPNLHGVLSASPDVGFNSVFVGLIKTLFLVKTWKNRFD